MEDPQPFDLESVYDDQIAPLMAQILQICQANNMPMLATFVYRRDDQGGYDLCTSAIPVEGRDPPELVKAYRAIYQA